MGGISSRRSSCGLHYGYLDVSGNRIYPNNGVRMMIQPRDKQKKHIFRKKTTFVWKYAMENHQQTVEDHTLITRQILQPILTRVMATPGVSCDTKVWGICDSDISDILLELETHTGHDL